MTPETTLGQLMGSGMLYRWYTGHCFACPYTRDENEVNWSTKTRT